MSNCNLRKNGKKGNIFLRDTGIGLIVEVNFPNFVALLLAKQVETRKRDLAFRVQTQCELNSLCPHAFGKGVTDTAIKYDTTLTKIRVQ